MVVMMVAVLVMVVSPAASHNRPMMNTTNWNIFPVPCGVGGGDRDGKRGVWRRTPPNKEAQGINFTQDRNTKNRSNNKTKATTTTHQDMQESGDLGEVAADELVSLFRPSSGGDGGGGDSDGGNDSGGGGVIDAGGPGCGGCGGKTMAVMMATVIVVD